MNKEYVLEKIKRKLNGEDVHFSIGIDQDEVLAKLNDKWIKHYNTIFDDNLNVEDIKDWDISKYVKEDAKPYIFNILNIHKFCRNLEVIDNSVRVIKELQDKGCNIFIVTDPFTRMSFKSKYDWLKENFPFINPRNFIFTGNKSAIGLDFLIDDGAHNCEGFQGIPLLYDAPHNEKEDRFYRVRNWQDIEHTFNDKLEEIYKFYKGDK